MDYQWILCYTLSYVFHSAGSCCIEELPSVSFNCCKCNLSVVPLDLPIYTTQLDLSFNPLKRLHKKEFLQMLKLEFLDLTRCSITSIEDHAFFGLENLQTLILTGNPISHWSPLTFSGLTFLNRLVIVETSLTSLSNLPVTQLTSLKELNVGRNLLKSLYLPSYVSSLHILNLYANQISDIKENDLKNLQNTNVFNLSLILSQNPIDYIAPGAFRFLSLHMLHLKGCFSNADIMNTNLNAMSGLRVEKLVVGHYRNSFSKISSQTGSFEGLCGMNVKELTINGLHFATNTFSECFRNLTSMRVVNTDLTLMSFQSGASNIEKLEIKQSLLFHMPSTAISALKQLKEIRITKNQKLENFEDLIEVPNLELLDLSNNNLKIDTCCSQISNGAPIIHHLNLSYNPLMVLATQFLNMSHLRTLDLSHTQLTNVGEYPVFLLLEKLIYLDVSYTSCHFYIQCSFCGLCSLEVLKVSHTTFDANILASVFKNLTELRFLDMSSCGLKYIPTETFVSLTLLHTLDLSKNNLLELQASVFSHLAALTYFNVSSNRFQSFSEETTQCLSQNLVKVDLSHNPYDCSCDQETFLLWVYEQSSRGLRFRESLECNTPEYLKGTQLSKVNLSCNLTIYVCFGVFAITVVIAGGLFHCYKQKYFHLCYLLQTDKYDNPEKEYDAFVIHSSIDEEWVKEQLVPKLEEGYPCFKLCLHYRDFIPGVPITSNIVNEGIRRSRKALVILSQNFIESKWCSFEFEMVLSWQFLESQCGIIVILLEAVNMAHLKHMLGLNKYLRKNTYLKWVDGYVERKVFWKRLREALQQGNELTNSAPEPEDVNEEKYKKQNEHNRMNL
ncbi:toll-like receptor 4 [Hyla sarda]|uniref:toll-like receptor 4 n=1 Tax=Hyla sarda TaxID=327740 RepID=UPI0024C2D5D9|nr:toll-like receptor 4 [Hyla sarda]XP_056395726.1 toll-like receptor 4 [Hyla sarda]